MHGRSGLAGAMREEEKSHWVAFVRERLPSQFTREAAEGEVQCAARPSLVGPTSGGLACCCL